MIKLVQYSEPSASTSVELCHVIYSIYPPFSCLWLSAPPSAVQCQFACVPPSRLRPKRHASPCVWTSSKIATPTRSPGPLSCGLP
jgi:hypothetical protein